MNVDAAPRLVQELGDWQSKIDAILGLVNEAEVLADLPVNISGQLDQIGADGRAMAVAISRAATGLKGYKLSLKGMGSGVAVPGLAEFHRERVDRRGRGPAKWRRTSSDDQETTERIDELVVSIQADTAAGRDPSARFRELDQLLNDVSGDSTGAAAMSATSMLLRGVPASELPELFANGHDVAFERISFAMEHGQSPEQAGLHPSLFPDEYVAWHETDAERQHAQDVADLNNDVWSLIVHNQGRTPQAVEDIEARIDAIPVGDPSRIALRLVLDSNYRLADLTTDQRRAIEAVFKTELDIAEAEVDRIQARLQGVAVPTLHGVTLIDEAGRLNAFDAIGAAAATVPRPPASFVGSSYGAKHATFAFDQVELAANFVADDTVAATSFFETLGPRQAALILHAYQLDDGRVRRGVADLPRSQLAVDLSRALGLASASLPTSFAVEMVHTQPESVGIVLDAIPPEWLFAYGEFDPAFLVVGAATSIEVHGNGQLGGIDGLNRMLANGVDPRTVILEPIVASNLGAALVSELGRRGDVDSLVWDDPPIRSGERHHISGEPIPPLSERVPLVTRVLLQAGLDDAASAILVDSAGSRLGDLDLNIANGMSQVLAAQISNYIDAGVDSPYFDAAHNVFAAGAGVDLDSAIRIAALMEFNRGFQEQRPQWWRKTAEIGHFAGLVDGRKFLIFAESAAARDKAIENAEKWISGLTASVGVVVGLAGIPFTGGASMGLALAGVGASGAGWVAPMFLDTHSHLEGFFYEHIETSIWDERNGRGLALWSAAMTDSIEVPGAGSVQALADEQGLYLLIKDDAGMHRTFRVKPFDSSWVTPAYDLLDELDVRVDLDQRDYDRTIVDALNIVGPPVFATSYPAGFAASARFRGAG